MANKSALVAENIEPKNLAFPEVIAFTEMKKK